MARSAPSRDARPRAVPVRTCVGCRESASKSDLVRVVAVRADGTTVLTPDITRSAGGRGAHLHPRLSCLDLAVRRRAFGRALRVEGPLDDADLRAHLRGSPTPAADDQTAGPNGPPTTKKRSTRS